VERLAKEVEMMFMFCISFPHLIFFLLIFTQGRLFLPKCNEALRCAGLATCDQHPSLTMNSGSPMYGDPAEVQHRTDAD